MGTSIKDKYFDIVSLRDRYMQAVVKYYCFKALGDDWWEALAEHMKFKADFYETKVANTYRALKKKKRWDTLALSDLDATVCGTILLYDDELNLELSEADTNRITQLIRERNKISHTSDSYVIESGLKATLKLLGSGTEILHKKDSEEYYFKLGKEIVATCKTAGISLPAGAEVWFDSKFQSAEERDKKYASRYDSSNYTYTASTSRASSTGAEQRSYNGTSHSSYEQRSYTGNSQTAYGQRNAESGSGAKYQAGREYFEGNNWTTYSSDTTRQYTQNKADSEESHYNAARSAQDASQAESEPTQTSSQEPSARELFATEFIFLSSIGEFIRETVKFIISFVLGILSIPSTLLEKARDHIVPRLKLRNPKLAFIVEKLFSGMVIAYIIVVISAIFCVGAGVVITLILKLLGGKHVSWF